MTGPTCFCSNILQSTGETVVDKIGKDQSLGSKTVNKHVNNNILDANNIMKTINIEYRVRGHVLHEMIQTKIRT